jgi:DNA polymerase-1
VLVERNHFEAVIKQLERTGTYGLDTEATGLKAYQGDRLFSVIIADEHDSFYFNFNGSIVTPGDKSLLPRAWLDRFKPVFLNPDSVWFIHNAKFDMGILYQEGLEIAGTVHCTQAIGRVIKNNILGGYSLHATAKRYGLEKSEKVEEYVKKHGLYEMLSTPGKKKKSYTPHYDKVPLEVIAPYGEKDAFLTRHIGLQQQKELVELRKRQPINHSSIENIYINERKLTKVCYEMEKNGVKIDRAFCKEALSYELHRSAVAMQSFESMTQTPFIDSNKELAKVFTKMGATFPTTDKGNPSFKDNFLESLDSPVAKCVQEIRDAQKKAGTYYSSFLYYADKRDVIHANMRQDGTEPGRFSYAAPNLQNIPKRGEDKSEYPVRRAFVPRDGFFFAMLDYDQMEYRLMLNYAAVYGDKDLINKIKGGLDVHEATAQTMGVSREHAKTINFGLLYGQGADKLAAALKLPVEQAKSLKRKYFDAIPGVENFLRRVQYTAKKRKHITNWAGRICYLSDPEFAYVMPNHLIQGGCADVVKIAMVRIHDFLRTFRSRMILQVHDELVFEIAYGEEHLIPALRGIMENVYPAKYLPLTVGVDFSKTSWHDKEEYEKP